MMLFDKLLNLRSDICAVEAHHEQLTHGPGSLQLVKLLLLAPAAQTDLSMSSQSFTEAMLEGIEEP